MSTGHLCPCPACNRHVMTDAGVCPFCQVALPATFCETSPPPVARPRMSRAARLLAGATLMGVSACSTESSTTPVYGAPFPVDAAVDRMGSDAATDAGGGLVPIYGAPIRTDGGTGG